METKSKRSPRPLTPDQAAIIDGLKTSLAVAPVGPDGRPSWVHRKQTITKAAAALTLKGMNRFAAARAAENAAGSVASKVSLI